MRKFLAVAVLAFMCTAMQAQQVQKYTDSNGLEWQAYGFTNLMFAVEQSVDNYLGKYYRLRMAIKNETGESISLGVTNFTAQIEKKGKKASVEVLTKEDYIKKMSAKQKLQGLGNALLKTQTAPQGIDRAGLDKYYLDNLVLDNGQETTALLALPYEKGDKLYLTVMIGGTPLEFEWDIKK